MVGTIIAAADNDYLYIVCFEDTKQFENKFKALAKELSCRFVHEENKILNTLKEELLSYFNGNLKKFSVPLKTLGSDFQKLDQAKFAPRIDYFTLPPRCGLKKGFAMTLKMIMFLSATKILTVLTRQADRGKVSGETGGPPRRIPARCKLSLVKL
uniref:Methylguanine DNA methyltransferase ribonuclease-like domain-containing protein n=1 Tax=Bombyx mori TaxID=7091 RepID=A0A8R2QXJ5_BOMMO|nr:uncharacterized protein LOC101737268 [Bombyx mori]XP_037868513.1 uncharacterized protein LOC119628831 [Bombyx mori]